MDLWVLPGPTKSKWFGRLDWYLNWQMSKGLSLEKQTASVELFRVIEDYGLKYEPTPDVATPLLVAARGRLPTSKCLVLQSTSDLKTWFTQISDIATKLNAKSLRVFLPSGSDSAAAAQAWPARDFEIQFSTDEEAL